MFAHSIWSSYNLEFTFIRSYCRLYASIHATHTEHTVIVVLFYREKFKYFWSLLGFATIWNKRHVREREGGGKASIRLKSCPGNESGRCAALVSTATSYEMRSLALKATCFCVPAPSAMTHGDAHVLRCLIAARKFRGELNGISLDRIEIGVIFS